MKNRRKAVQPFEIKKRKIDIFRNYEAYGFEKNQRKFENFSTLISKKSKERRNHFFIAGLTCHLQSCEFSISSSFRLCCKGTRTLSLTKGHIRILVADL